MVDEIPFSLITFPVKAEATASASYHRSHETFVYDSKVYPPCTNKIEDVGLLRRRKLSIICDGQGKMNIKEILDPIQKLEKLKKAVKKGLITEEDYERKKQDILDREI